MKVFNSIFLGLILVSILSCDKEEEEPTVTIADIAGSWKATSSVFTNKANANDEIDLISIGAELRFTMLDDGGVRTWFNLDTISDEWDSQAVLKNGSTLTLTPVEMERGVSTYELVLDENTLELTNENTSFDFTFSGAEEVPARSVAIFERN